MKRQKSKNLKKDKPQKSTISKSPTVKKNKEFYVKPAEFHSAIVLYYDQSSPDIPHILGDMIQKIATKISFLPNFKDYSYKEEMIGDAVVRMISALKRKKYDLQKGNPFSYFTKIAIHAFISRIKKEKQNQNTLKEYRDEQYLNLTTSNEAWYMTRQRRNTDMDENEFYFENNIDSFFDEDNIIDPTVMQTGEEAADFVYKIEPDEEF